MTENSIICGPALETLQTLPAESINCCISSPPYWGLRAYGTDPQVWGGDKNCEHKWGQKIEKLRTAGDRPGKNSLVAANRPDDVNRPNQISQFCSKCNAWLGELGLEPTFELYIEHLCTIYDEVFRVLRPDGTCFVNLGDTYGTHAGTKNSKHAHNFRSAETAIAEGVYQPRKPQSVPEKSLCLIPQRFAIEMVNRGWILRNVIIWHKPNPMPSSAKDRFTVDYEQVFFFVKSNETLQWVRPDGVMVTKQPDYKSGEQGLDWQWGERKKKRVKLSLWNGYCYFFEPQYEPYLTESNAERPRMGQGTQTKYQSKRGFEGKWKSEDKQSSGKRIQTNLIEKRKQTGEHDPQFNPLGRNKRTVWTIPTQAYPDAHFATFPEKLVEPMILSGCPREVCTKCGQGRRKVYEKSGGTTGKSWHPHKNDIGEGNVKQQTGKEFESYKIDFKGYTDCGCGEEWRPGIVLDCFWGKWNCWQGRRAKWPRLYLN